MKVACLDTQIVIWIFQSALNQHWQPEHQVRIAKSVALIKFLEKEDFRVTLPTPVVAELLVKIPGDEHDEFVKRLERDFSVADFDLRAARKFAQVKFRRLSPAARWEIGERNPDATRRELDADTMILSTAMVDGAARLYTNDRRFKSLASLADDPIHILLLDELDLPGEQLSLDLPDPNPDE